MTRKGFKAVIIREEAYNLADKQARLEETSIADIVTRAVQRYINRRSEVEEDLGTLLRIYEDYKRKSRALPSAQHTS